MAILVTFPDGTNQLIPKAVRVDQTNYHEGTYDFYGEGEALLEQIDMSSGITWEVIEEPKED